MERVFLLGGHDLEMLTIKELLRSCSIRFYDKNLTWDKALLSAYSEELEKYAHQDCMIVGVELREDVVRPKNYTLIDHHNNRSDSVSSLEQVAYLLDIELNRWQQLVAVNDRGYIGGLRQLGASDYEIEQIRRADRAAQGVTEEDERLAEKSVNEAIFKNGIMIVKTKCLHFSPITDRLYPFDNLLIYSDKSLGYYGEGCKKLVAHYQKDIMKGRVYYGGGEKGFVGFDSGSFSKTEIENQIKVIIKIVGR